MFSIKIQNDYYFDIKYIPTYVHIFFGFQNE